MKCEYCGGQTENIGNNRNVKVRTLAGVIIENISQLKCLHCGKYSSSLKEYAPKNMSIGYDVIDFIMDERKSLTQEQVRQKLKYKHNFDISIGSICRIEYNNKLIPTCEQCMTTEKELNVFLRVENRDRGFCSVKCLKKWVENIKVKK